MELINRYVTRTVLNEWEAQGFASQVSGIRVDAELESFNTTLPRLALRVYRRSVLMAIVYGYQTRANMLADTGQDENVGAVVFADATNANNDLYFRASGTWVADTLWGMSNAFKAAVTAINASQTLQTTTPTPGAPGAGVPADGVNGSLLGFSGGSPAWRTPVQSWADQGIAPDANLPGRLRAGSLTVTDWDTAIEAGFYNGANTALNAPAADFFAGYAATRNTSTELIVTRVGTAGSESNSVTWRRLRTGGVWSAWQRIRKTEGELDARYVQSAVAVFTGPPQIPSYTVATVPAAASFPRGLIYVSNGTSNKRLAISDGANWRFPDGAIVS